MALDSIFKMLENPESRGDRRVKIAWNTGLQRKKLIPVTEAIVKSCAKPTDLNRKILKANKEKKEISISCR